MDSTLDTKEELICKIRNLSESDTRILSVFMSGMEAERTVLEREKSHLKESCG